MSEPKKKGFWANLLNPDPPCVCPTVVPVEEGEAKAATPQTAVKVTAATPETASRCTAEQTAACNAAAASTTGTAQEQKPATS